jgi:hypothetical protein
MPYSVTEDWKGKGKPQEADQKDTAQRTFVVVPLPGEDEDDAVAAVTADFGISVGGPYDATDSNNLLVCKSMHPHYTANNVIEVGCSFDVPPCGSYLATERFTSLPPSYHWQTVIDTQPFDRDTANNPVLNSSYDPPRNPPTRTVTYKELTVTTYAQFYDYTTYKYYENCVNGDTITLVEPNGNDSDFGPGTMKCISIEPGKAYNKTDTVVPIVMKFHIYDQSEINLADPFQLHLLDAGSAGYWNNAGTNTRGNIVNPDGSQPACDVALNGHGKPIDATLLISPSSQGGQPQTPVNCTRDVPPGAKIETSGSGVFACVYLKYFRYLSTPFAPLLT